MYLCEYVFEEVDDAGEEERQSQQEHAKQRQVASTLVEGLDQGGGMTLFTIAKICSSHSTLALSCVGVRQRIAMIFGVVNAMHVYFK